MAESFQPRALLETLARHGANFTFDTGFGPLDILSDPDGAPPYEQLREAAGSELLVEGLRIRVASLDHLIAMKEAAGRPKDLLAQRVPRHLRRAPQTARRRRALSQPSAGQDCTAPAVDRFTEMHCHVDDRRFRADEGDGTFHTADGSLVGPTTLNAKRRFEEDGELELTLPGAEGRRDRPRRRPRLKQGARRGYGLARAQAVISRQGR